jgi:hypothetical protein
MRFGEARQQQQGRRLFHQVIIAEARTQSRTDGLDRIAEFKFA